MTQTEETTRVDVPETLTAATLPAVDWRRLAKMAGRFGTVAVDGSAGTVTVTGGPSTDWTYTFEARDIGELRYQGVATFAGPSLKALRAEVTGGVGTRPVTVSARGDYAVVGAATIPMDMAFAGETAPAGTETATLVVSLDTFRTAVNAVAPAAMADMSRTPALRCVAWRPLAGDIVATDSYRIHIGELRALGARTAEPSPSGADAWQLLVPADAMSLVAGELKSSKSQTMLVSVHYRSTKSALDGKEIGAEPVGVTFHGDRWTLYSRLDTSTYVPWERLVPPASDHHLIVRTDALEPALVAAVKFHAAVTGKKTDSMHPVRLTAVAPDTLQLTIIGENLAGWTAKVPTASDAFRDLPNEIAFNPIYLLAAVRAVASGDDQGDAVTIATIDSGRPATISGQACTGTVRALLMPVRVN